jgi:hypothetical protein
MVRAREAETTIDRGRLVRVGDRLVRETEHAPHPNTPTHESNDWECPNPDCLPYVEPEHHEDDTNEHSEDNGEDDDFDDDMHVDDEDSDEHEPQEPRWWRHRTTI